MPEKIYKWKNKETGEIFEGDEFGNRLHTLDKPNAKREYILPSKPLEAEGGIRAPTMSDVFYNQHGRFIPPALTAIGGLVGAMGGSGFGSAFMGARGAGLGSSAGKALQTLAPSLFGEYKPESLSDIPQDIGIDMALDLVGTGVGKGLGKLTQPKQAFEEAIAKIFKPSPRVPQGAYNPTPLPKEFPELNLTTGQTNRLGNFIENVGSPTEKELIIAGQERKIGDWFGRQKLDTEQLVQTGQVNAKAQRDAMLNQRTALYNDFKPFVAKNSKTVEVVKPVKNKGVYGFGTAQPTSTFTKIEGAIPLKASKQFAEDLGAQIDKELGPDDINLQGLGAGVGNNLKRIKAELDKIRGVRTAIDPKTGVHTDDPLMDFYQLKTLKDSLNQFLRSNADPVLKDRLRGSLKSLASTINKDIDEGVKGWGTQAYRTYRKAQDYHANMVKKLRPKMAKDIINAGEAETTYMEIANEALSDPQRMREFITTTNDKATAKQLFMDAMSRHSEDAASGTFDASKALQYMADKELVAKEMLTPQYRTNVKRFLQQANQVKPLDWQSFSNALNMTQGRAALSAGIGIGSLPFTGDPKLSTLFSAGVFFAPQAAKEFSKRILMDARYTQIATGAMKASPASAKGKMAARALLGAAKGLQVILMTKDGREVPTTIDENGKIVLPDPNASTSTEQ